MIASQETNGSILQVIELFHGAVLLFFGIRIVFAGIKVSELWSPPDSYNSRQFTFGYFSLSAWILWVFQYAILTTPFFTLPSGASLTTVLWLGVAQNVLWACAAFSFHSNYLSRKLLTVPLLLVLSVVIAFLAYQTGILSSPDLIVHVAVVDFAFNAASFMILGISIFQLGFGKGFTEAFLTHGYTQWVWRLLWLSPWATVPVVQLAFPAWRIVLFIVWTRLISEMAKRTEPVDQKIAQVAKQPQPDIQIPKTPNLVVTFKVMISSTVEDLGPEREAADHAISKLKLTRFRAETLGSFPHAPDVICAFMAEQCDIFVLIIGERYGYTVRSREMSVVEFEYEVARRQNRGKILVYIKEGVTRDPRLEPFVKRLEDFEDGHFRSLFKTPEELEEKIHDDIQRWILLRAIGQI